MLILKGILFGIFLGTGIILLTIHLQSVDSFTLIIYAMILFSSIMALQGFFSLFLMLYVWIDASREHRNTHVDFMDEKQNSFTALIPARHEERVIADTIKAVSDIDYPEGLKEALIICRSDDTHTIEKAKQAIATCGKDNIKLIIFNDSPINKPHSLNIGLSHATKDVVVIFDAEDQPHKNIYTVVNSVMMRNNSEVVQSGVQLMNYRSSWFSTLNILEYFFWFKSSLHFFADAGIIPLGGNSVFFKRYILNRADGWDETCLTEDAEIGIRLSTQGAKIHVIYDERFVTQEETPHNLRSFIKQRTRWNQGFIQILLKGEWMRLPKLSQKFLAFYILLLPEIQAILFFLIPLSVIMAFSLKLPIGVALFTIFSLLLMLLQLIAYNVGLYEFTRNYKLQYPFLIPFKTLLTFYPFQIVLGLCSLRAFIRTLFGKTSWEKTHHVNAHRAIYQSPPVYS